MGGVVDSVTGIVRGIGGAVGYGGASQMPTAYNQAQLDEAQQGSMSAIQNQQNLADQIAAQGGLSHQADVYNQQQQLANSLQNQTAGFQATAMGQGPNPVQAQYLKNLNAGTQAAAGTIASQKGISPALAAQLIAQQQGAANQNAAGTSAVNQAQQQLTAQQNAMQSNQQLLNQQAQMQGVSSEQIGQQATANQNITAARQGQQQLLTNAFIGAGTSNLGSQQAQASRRAATTGGMLGAVGTAFGLGGMGGGKPMSGGSGTADNSAGDFGGAKGGEVQTDNIMSPSGANKVFQPMPDHIRMVSDIYHGPKTEEHDYVMPERKASGGYASYQEGALIPGTPKVDHNSYSNDNVKALLSPGEVVIPLNVMNSDNPAQEAAKFVQALMDKKGKDSLKDESSKEDFHKSLKEAINKRGRK